MDYNGIEIVDTFAEAFPMKGARVILTAVSERWVGVAVNEMCGYATSVIACDCEAALERTLVPDETPDGRPGAAVLVFAFSREALAKALQGRIGQCVLTCPTTACYNGISGGDPEKRVAVGGAIRYFGDGFQSSKKLATRRFWRIPVMDGEFLVEDKFETVTGVAGGNLLICGTDQSSALSAAEAAADAIQRLPEVIAPFPGGIVRSGSKVGSRYPKLKASTNDQYCPTLRPLTQTAIPEECGAVYELVIDGLRFEAVQAAMRAALQAAASTPGVLRITAGNYGGQLGKHHFHLRDLL